MKLILKPTDTARVQEVTDSEPATVVVEEPLILRRGGRGRGRKEVTAKETVVHVISICNNFNVCITFAD